MKRNNKERSGTGKKGSGYNSTGKNTSSKSYSGKAGKGEKSFGKKTSYKSKSGDSEFSGKRFSKDSDKKSYGSSRGDKKFSSGRSDEKTGNFRDKKKFSSSENGERGFDKRKKPSDTGREKKFTSRGSDEKTGNFKDNKKYSSSEKEERSFDRKKGTGKSYDSNRGKKFSSRESDEKGGKFGAKKKYSSSGREERSFDKSPKKSFSTSEKKSLPPDYSFKNVKKKKTEETKTDDNAKVRLNKYISNSGVCSRRDADILIEKGQITVNGKVVTELGYKVESTDVVKFNGRVLQAEKHVYVLLNKPKDFLTTTDDPEERRTVMELVKNACDQRIYPVGRLDRQTTGLLLFTNDGELAKKLMHPSNKIKKVYQADLDKPLSKDDFAQILNGLELEDGPVTVDALAYVASDKKSVGLEIHEGRNRIVRRIFEHLGYKVEKLDRVMYADLTKKDLPRGKWRYLSEKEVIRLKHFV